jgi:hypothetical protein
MNYGKKAGIIVIALTALVLTTAADCDTHDDSGSGDVNHAPADIIEFPDGFRNVAHKCDGANMVYSVSAGVDDTLSGSIAVVANDPRCAR